MSHVAFRCWGRVPKGWESAGAAPVQFVVGLARRCGVPGYLPCAASQIPKHAIRRLKPWKRSICAKS